MRKTFRTHKNKDYWDLRWNSVSIDQPMTNISKYPLKYAIQSIRNKKDTLLEAGCGNGRILRYFHNNGYDIHGFDFIQSAILNLQKCDPGLKVRVDDVMKLSYESEMFDCVLAFGLYHNLEEDGLRRAVSETHRLMKEGGRLCASFRADNIQNRINDFIARRKSPPKKKEELKFHKMNLRHGELKRIFEEGGFFVKKIRPVENMPLLYKTRLFRAQGHKTFDESLGRREGYKLSTLGQTIQGLLIGLFPHQFCNIYVLDAEKRIDA
jgi:SAM-dependent methyltransferase